MPVPDRALLVAMHRAFGTVHVQGDALRRAPGVHRVNPAARQVGQGGEVLGLRQHLGLEPTHRACRSRTMHHGPAADDLAHHRVSAQPVGVMDVLVAGKPREDRMALQPGEAVAAVPAGPRIADQPRRRVGQAEGVVQLPVQEQATVRADRGPRKANFTERSNWSRSGPVWASPVVSATAMPIRSRYPTDSMRLSGRDTTTKRQSSGECGMKADRPVCVDPASCWTRIQGGVPSCHPLPPSVKIGAAREPDEIIQLIGPCHPCHPESL